MNDLLARLPLDTALAVQTAVGNGACIVPDAETIASLLELRDVAVSDVELLEEHGFVRHPKIAGHLGYRTVRDRNTIFLDANAPAGGLGTAKRPVRTIAEAQAAEAEAWAWQKLRDRTRLSWSFEQGSYAMPGPLVTPGSLVTSHYAPASAPVSSSTMQKKR